MAVQNVPPPLAWITGFMRSVECALGSSIIYSLIPTVNPLVYKVRISFMEKIAGRNLMLVWNLFQMYAAHNDCLTQGKSPEEGHTLLAEVVMKQRLGLPRDAHPLG